MKRTALTFAIVVSWLATVLGLVVATLLPIDRIELFAMGFVVGIAAWWGGLYRLWRALRRFFR